ncbi:MAG: hypothetical protein E7402_02180 [Ruminococcaceae bacterium]|nr:hypothetical protein [Oscillospiraceae bacterium]
MIIRKIEIEQFGGLRHYSLNLSGGFQYLYGENEAGKSTLCAFLSAMFYGLPGKQRGGGLRGDARNFYMPWGETYMAGMVQFSAGDKEYVLKRRFGRTGRSDQCMLMSADDWTEIPIEPEQIGPKFLGMGPEAFHKTICIKQSGAAFSKDKEDELMDRLSNLEQSGDEDASVQKALAELSAASCELISKTGRGGAIRQLEAEIEALEAEAERVRGKHLAFQDMLEENKHLITQNQEAEAQLSNLEAQYKEALAYEQYCQRMEQQKSRDELIERCEAEKSLLAETEKEHGLILSELEALEAETMPAQETILLLAEKEALCSVLAEKEQARQALVAELQTLQDALSATDTGQSQKHSTVWYILAGLLAGASVLCALLVSPAFYFMLLPALVFVFLPHLSGRKKETKQKEALHQALYAEKKQQLDILNEEDFAGQMKTLTEEIQTVYQKAKVDSLAALSQKAEQVRLARERLIVVEQERERRKESLAGLSAAFSHMTVSEEENPVTYDGPTTRELTAMLSLARETQVERERKQAQLQATLDSGFADSRSISVIETEIKHAREHHAELLDRHRAIELARKALEDCHEELKQVFAPALNEKSSALIERLTGGRYREIKVTDDYAMMLKTPDGSEIVESDYVSAGTCDLLYFALRIAVLQTLYEKIPLLILDDTFIQMDEKRQKEAFSLLSEPIADQILYFSCHKAENMTEI